MNAIKNIKIFSVTILLLVFIVLLAVNGFSALTFLEFGLVVIACLTMSVVLDIANHVRENTREIYLRSLGRY